MQQHNNKHKFYFQHLDLNVLCSICFISLSCIISLHALSLSRTTIINITSTRRDRRQLRRIKSSCRATMIAVVRMMMIDDACVDKLQYDTTSQQSVNSAAQHKMIKIKNKK